jgi:hypothetical protein
VKPARELPKRSHVAIDEDLKTIEFRTKGMEHSHRYPLAQCSSPQGILNLMFQVRNRSWSQPEHLYELIGYLNSLSLMYLERDGDCVFGHGWNDCDIDWVKAREQANAESEKRRKTPPA